MIDIGEWIESTSEADVPLLTEGYRKITDDDQENRDVQLGNGRKRCRDTADIQVLADQNTTPRPAKRYRTAHPHAVAQLSASSASSSFSCDSVGPHSSVSRGRSNSGRISPTKQLAFLQDLANPVHFVDFESRQEDLPPDVENLYQPIQEIADGLHFIPVQATALEEQLRLTPSLSARETRRFRYPWVTRNDLVESDSGCSFIPMDQVHAIVSEAHRYDSHDADEDSWNTEVHSQLLKLGLASSLHKDHISLRSTKMASIDPKWLAPLGLPRRVVDYSYVLQPDAIISEAWTRLEPLQGAIVKSWNNTTKADLRETPIAINIETKASTHSWTDGRAQVAIWVSSLLARLRLVSGRRVEDSTDSSLCIPAMPLLIIQGHDWYLLIVSQTMTESRIKTIIWQKLNIGSTRNCFETYKIIAVLQLLVNWAETIWRPWFHSLISRNEDLTGD